MYNVKTVTNEEYLKRIAYAHASGLKETKFSRFYHNGDPTWVSGAKKQLKQRGISDEEMELELPKYVDALKSYMNTTDSDRDEWCMIHEEVAKLGLDDPNKSSSLARYLDENKIDEYWYRKLRTGYTYFTDVLNKMTDAERTATINSGKIYKNEKLRFMFGAKPIGDDKHADMEETEDKKESESVTKDFEESVVNGLKSINKVISFDDCIDTEELEKISDSNCSISISRSDTFKSIDITVPTNENLNRSIRAFIFELVDSYLC